MRSLKHRRSPDPAHKTEPIRKWLGSRPGWHVHFTPTTSSWVNQVERFFADITEKQIRRGVHRSTAELETAIRDYLDAVNADPWGGHELGGRYLFRVPPRFG